ncbi:MAG: DUF2909 domain-containing protein [Pseudomonadales bacterium]
MWLKVVIVILFVGLVISLLSGLAFLMKDRGTSSRRTWNALSVRLVLAGLLIGFLFYGVFTGQLGSNAPWDARYADKLTPPAVKSQIDQTPIHSSE